MVKALQMMYNATYSIATVNGKYSREFRTFSGIRQGATSSSNLFLAFMDADILIGDFHSLLHADDTVLLSISPQTFVKKCKEMVRFFNEKKLSLIIGKSRFMVINGKLDDTKEKLDRKRMFELHTISDFGKLKDDFENNITIKFLNFCRSNYMAPVSFQSDVLNACLKSTIVFGYEIWGNSHLDKLEGCYRNATKYAQSVRPSVNNEIIY